MNYILRKKILNEMAYSWTVNEWQTGKTVNMKLQHLWKLMKFSKKLIFKHL